MRHEVGIGDQNARRILVGAEHADRLARLHKQGFVVVERLQRCNDTVEIVPCAGSATNAAVDNQLMRAFGNIRVEIVHEHTQRRFGKPALGVEFGAAWSTNVAFIMTWVGHSVLLEIIVGRLLFAAVAKGF